MLTLKNIMTYYDKISSSYEKLYKKEQLKKWKECKDLINIKGRVLDAGCGTGFITRKIPDCVGIDNSMELLKNSKNPCVLGNIEKMPFKNNVFDTIISFTVLQDIKNPKKASEELTRVLKKNGRILITVLNKERIKNIRKILYKYFKNLKEKKIKKDVVFFT